MEPRIQIGSQQDRRGGAEAQRNTRSKFPNVFSGCSSGSARVSGNITSPCSFDYQAGPLRLSAPRRPAKGLRAKMRGFTFVELLVVITIVVILITMAVPIYNKSIIRTKEAVLRSNLFSLRTVIDNYTYDKQKAPQSLQELVTAGYLRDVPLDPMTGSKDWRTIMEDATQSVNQTEPGIFDVRSMSEKTGLDGTAYSEW